MLFSTFGYILLPTAAVWANPVGEQVVGGSATFNRQGNNLTVNQATDRLAVNWQDFSIAAGEATHFNMPSASSIALNRVLGGNPSQIYGTLSSNGNIILVNNSGIFVGPGGVVNAASFVGSTLDIDPGQFMKAGQDGYQLHGSSYAPIVNQGNITAEKGDVFLIAQKVENRGTISAPNGTAAMVGTGAKTEVVLHEVGGSGFAVRVAQLEGEAASGSNHNLPDGEELLNEGEISAAQAELNASGNIYALAIKNTGTIRAKAVVANADGTVRLDGGLGDVRNAGTLIAKNAGDEATAAGGKIEVVGQNVTASPESIITAAGGELGGNGGKVKIDSTDTTIVQGKVDVSAPAASTKGGKVELLGERVGLFDGAKVDASGGAGGGTVLVGGDYLGGQTPKAELKDLAKQEAEPVKNAKATVMADTAEIKADATVNGDGGKVILWSDEYTGFYGQLFARGGANGGNGGFIETSSKDNLQAFGSAMAAAAAGQGGLWLLDPANVNITGATANGAFDNNNPNTFTPNANAATVLNTTINSSLDAGVSVIITTAFGAGTDPGNITVSSAISKTAGNSATLRLVADNDITTAAAITSTTGSLAVEMVAGTNGAITLGSGAITTNGGYVSLSAGDGIIFNNANAVVTTSGGAFVADADSNADGAGKFTIGNFAATLVDTRAGLNPAGSITITSAEIAIGGALGGAINAGGSNIQLINSVAANSMNVATLPIGPYDISQTTLNNISTSGLLLIGGPNQTGTIRVGSPDFVTGVLPYGIQFGSSAATPINLANDILTTGKVLNFLGAVTLSPNSGTSVALNTTAGGTAVGADILFLGASTLDSDSLGSGQPRALTITAGTSGRVFLPINIGNTTPLGSLALTAGGGILLQDATSITTLKAGQGSPSGNVTFNNSILPTVSGTGTRTLAITTQNGGDVSFQAVGSSANPIDGLTVSSGTGSIFLNNSIFTAGGAVNLGSAVTLQTGAITIDTTRLGNTAGAAISFLQTLSGTQNLTLLAGTGGALNFGGSVSGLTGLTVTSGGAFTVDNGSNFSVAGNITIDPQVVTNGNDITMSTTVGSNGNITLNSGLITNPAGSFGRGGRVTLTAGGTGILTINGELNASGLSGTFLVGTTTVATVGFDGGTVSLSGAAITTGAILANGDRDQTGNSRGGNGGSITITSAGAKNIGSLSVQGAVGSPAGKGGSITLAGAGANTLNGSISLDAGNGQAAGDLGGGAGTLTFTGGGAVTLNNGISANGGNGNGSAGGGSAGVLTFPGLTLGGANVAITARGGNNGTAGTGRGSDGVLTFSGTVNGAVAGANSLEMDVAAGTVTFSLAVGATTRLGQITIQNARNVTFGSTLSANKFVQNASVPTGGIFTTANQDGTTTFSGAVTLSGAGTVLDLTGYNFTFGSGVTASTGSINGVINGVFAVNTAGLSLGGDLTLASGSVPGSNPRVDLNVIFNIGDITTAAIRTSSGALTFGTVANPLNVRLLRATGLSTGSSGGQISFGGLLDSDATARNLTLNSGGAVTLNGLVGSLNPLGDLTTDAGGSLVLAAAGTRANPSINATGTLLFNDQVDLQSGTVLKANGVTLSSTGLLDGANNLLTLLPSSPVATSAPSFVLNQFYKITDLGDTTQNQWNTMAGTTGQTYAIGSVFQAKALIGAGAGTGKASDSLMALNGQVGRDTALSSLRVEGGSGAVLNFAGTQANPSVKTTGNQYYGSAVTLGADTVLTAGTMDFVSTIDGAKQLVLVSSGDINFSGRVGNSFALAGFEAPGAGDLNFRVKGAGTTFTTTGGFSVPNASIVLFETTRFLAGRDVVLGPVVGGLPPVIFGFETSSGQIVINGDLGALGAPLGGVEIRARGSRTLPAGSYSQDKDAQIALNGNIYTLPGTVPVNDGAFGHVFLRADGAVVIAGDIDTTGGLTGPTVLTGDVLIAAGLSGRQVNGSLAPENLIQMEGSIRTRGGKVTFGEIQTAAAPYPALTANQTGRVFITGNTLIDTFADNGQGSIVFNGTLNGAPGTSLTINAGTAAVSFLGQNNTTDKIAIGDLGLLGLTVNSSGALSLGGNVRMGGNFLFNNLAGAFTTSAGLGAFYSIDGNFGLTINPINDSANVTLGAVGSSVALTSIAVGPSANAKITLNGNLNTAGGEITLLAPTLINGDLTIDTTKLGQDTGGNVFFQNTLSGADGTGDKITIRAGSDGNISFGGDVGAIDGLKALSGLKIVSAGGIGITSGGKFEIAGDIDITPRIINAARDLTMTTTAAGNIILRGGVDLGGVGVQSNGGKLTLTSDGSITIEGNVDLSGGSAVGQQVGPGGNGGALTLTAQDSLNLGTINLSGGLGSGSSGRGGDGGNLSMKSVGPVDPLNGNNIAFASIVLNGGDGEQNNSGGNSGGITAIRSASGSVLVEGQILGIGGAGGGTGGAGGKGLVVDFSDAANFSPLVLAVPEVRIAAYGGDDGIGTGRGVDGQLTFGTVNGQTVGINSLILDVGAGSITFKNPLGATTPLAELRVLAAKNLTFKDAATVNASRLIQERSVPDGGIYTENLQGKTTFGTGTVTLTGSGQVLSLTGYDFVLGGSVVTTTGNGSVRVENFGNLSVTGASTSLGGDFIQVAGDPLATVTLSANLSNSGGAMSFESPVALGADVTLSNRGAASVIGGSIEFQSTVNSQGATARSLTLNSGGAVTFGDLVGNLSALSSINTDAGGALVMAAANGSRSVPSLTLNGTLSVSDQMLLEANTVVRANSFTLQSGGLLDGANDLLTLLPSSPVATSAPSFVLNQFYKITDLGDTTQTQWNTMAGTTGQTYAIGSVFQAKAPIGAGAGTGKASDSLMVLNGQVGRDTALSSLRVEGGSGAVLAFGGTETQPSVAATGNLYFEKAVTLGVPANGTVVLSAGTMDFLETINGANSLVLNSNGDMNINGQVGGTANLDSLRTIGSGSLNLRVFGSTATSPTITTTGAQSFSGPMALFANSFLKAGNDMYFGGLISIGSGTPPPIFGVETVDTTPLTAGGGQIIFDGAIGSPGSALGGFLVTARGFRNLSDDPSSPKSSQTKDAQISINNNVYTFPGVNPVNPGAFGQVVIQADGAVVISGIIDTRGTSDPTVITGDVRIAAGQTTRRVGPENLIQLQGSILTRGGSVTFGEKSKGQSSSTGNIYLTGASTISTGPDNAQGFIDFQGTINGGSALTINAGAAEVNFSKDIGADRALTSLTLSDASKVTLKGNITTTGGILLGGPTVLDGTSFNFTTTARGSAGGGVSFLGSLKAFGANTDLTINAGQGNISLADEVSGFRDVRIESGGGFSFTGSSAITSLRDVVIVPDVNVSAFQASNTGTSGIRITAGRNLTLQGGVTARPVYGAGLDVNLRAGATEVGALSVTGSILASGRSGTFVGFAPDGSSYTFATVGYNGGNVTLKGSSISVASVDASGSNNFATGGNGGNGGTVIFESAGAVTVGAINVGGGTDGVLGGRGGSIDITRTGATGNLTIGTLSALGGDSSNGVGAGGGSISIQALLGNLVAPTDFRLAGGGGSQDNPDGLGGLVSLRALAGDISFGTQILRLDGDSSLAVKAAGNLILATTPGATPELSSGGVVVTLNDKANRVDRRGSMTFEFGSAGGQFYMPSSAYLISNGGTIQIDTKAGLGITPGSITISGMVTSSDNVNGGRVLINQAVGLGGVGAVTVANAIETSGGTPTDPRYGRSGGQVAIRGTDITLNRIVTSGSSSLATTTVPAFGGAGGDIIVTASGTITLRRNIIASGGNGLAVTGGDATGGAGGSVQFNGNVVLNSGDASRTTILINTPGGTGQGDGDPGLGGNILVTGSITGTPTTSNTLDLRYGSGTATLGNGLPNPAADTITLGTLITAADDARSTGNLIINGKLDLGTLITYARGYGIQINGGGTIANTVTFNNTGVVALGNQSLNAETIFNGGVDATSAAITKLQGTIVSGELGSAAAMNFGAVQLVGNTAFDTNGGNLKIGSIESVGQNYDLTFDSGIGAGTIDISSTVGATTRLGAITVSGGITQPVLFQDSVRATSFSSATGTTLYFGGNVDLTGAANLSGATTLDNTLYASQNSTLLFTVGAASTFGGALKLANGPIELASSGAGAPYTFNGTVDGAQNLFLTGLGAKTFNGVMGGITAIGTGLNAAITMSGGDVTFGNLTTASGLSSTADVTFLGDVTLRQGDGTQTSLAGSTDFGAITFTSNNTLKEALVSGVVTLLGNISFDGAGAYAFGDAINGGGTGVASRSITLANSLGATFSDVIGGGAGRVLGFTQLGTAGPVTFKQNVTTTGNSTFAGSVVLDGMDFIGGDGAGDSTTFAGVSLSSGPVILRGSGSYQVNGLVAGAGQTLGLQGGGAKNFVSAVNVLAINQNAGEAATFRQDVTTTGNSTFAGSVVLDGMDFIGGDGAGDSTTFAGVSLSGGPVILRGSGSYQVNGAVTGAQALTLAGSNTKTFNSTVTVGNGTTAITQANVVGNDATFAQDLVLNGVSSFARQVTLDGMKVTANGATSLNTVVLSGGEVTLEGAGAYTTSGAVTGDQDFSLSGSGTKTFASTINSADLKQTGGQVKLGGNVTTTGLVDLENAATTASLTVASGGSTQTYDALTLGGNLTANTTSTVNYAVVNGSGNMTTEAQTISVTPTTVRNQGTFTAIRSGGGDIVVGTGGNFMDATSLQAVRSTGGMVVQTTGKIDALNFVAGTSISLKSSQGAVNVSDVVVPGRLGVTTGVDPLTLLNQPALFGGSSSASSLAINAGTVNPLTSEILDVPSLGNITLRQGGQTFSYTTGKSLNVTGPINVGNGNVELAPAGNFVNSYAGNPFTAGSTRILTRDLFSYPNSGAVPGLTPVYGVTSIGQLGANQIGVTLPLLAGSAAPYITEFTTGTGQPYVLATQENAVPTATVPVGYSDSGAFPVRVTYSSEELEMMTPAERAAYESQQRRQSAKVILERQPGQAGITVPAESKTPQARVPEKEKSAPTAQVTLDGKPLAAKSDKEKGDAVPLMRIRSSKAVVLRPEIDTQGVMENERLAAEVNMGAAPVAGK